MTVHEAVKKFGLESFEKRYYNALSGKAIPFPIIKKLVDTEVISMAVDFQHETVNMGIWYFEEE